LSPAPPALEFAFTVEAKLGAPLDLGIVRQGRRRIIPILGGSFAGPKICGRVLAGGADWQIVANDGSAELDARYTLESDTGALIYVSNRGMRQGPSEILTRLNAGETVSPAEYYFRSVPVFETSAPDCAWLMRSIFLAAGERYSDGVKLHFWRIL
jgi:hypothetical protein